MIFCMSMGLIWLGVVLGGMISLGMAFTVTLVVLAVMSGRAGLMAAASRRVGGLQAVEHLMEAGFGLVTAGLGLLMLVSVF